MGAQPKSQSHLSSSPWVHELYHTRQHQFRDKPRSLFHTHKMYMKVLIGSDSLSHFLLFVCVYLCTLCTRVYSCVLVCNPGRPLLGEETFALQGLSFSVCLSLSLITPISLFLILSLSLSLSHTHTHTPHPFCPRPPHTRTLSHERVPKTKARFGGKCYVHHCRWSVHSHTHTHTHSHAHTLLHTHTRTLTRTHSHAHTHTHTLIPSLS